jgi:hypothetical protein
MRTLLIAATLGLLSLPAAAQNVAEPSSGVQFPVMLPVGSAHHALAGTGLRTRTFLNVKVYAAGLYLEPGAARTSLASFAGKDAAALAADNAVYDALLRMSFPMSLRLVMTRNVSGDQMKNAFDEVLAERVAAAAQHGMQGGDVALQTFKGYFSLDRLTSGTELVFTCENGNLHSIVGSETKAVIASPALCWSLFDVYLGHEPIQANIKRGLVGRLPEVLAGR